MSEFQDLHRQSLEEEDLVQRSTKKLKEDASLVMEVDQEVQLQSQKGNQDSMQKVSYKDKVMGMDSPSEFLPEEIVQMVTEDLFPDLNTEEGQHHEKKNFNPNPTVKNEIQNTAGSDAPPNQPEKDSAREQSQSQERVNPISPHPDTPTNPDQDESTFGPWMLVKKAPRKKFKPHNQNSAPTQAHNPDSLLGNSNAPSSRFEVLQSHLEDSKDPSTDTDRVNSTPKQIKHPSIRPTPHTQSLGKGHKPNSTQKKVTSNQKEQLAKMPKLFKASHQPQKQTQDSPAKDTPSEVRQIKEKNEDWEKEILAMMSRYNHKRWEAHSKGEYVGDYYSCNKQEFLNTLYGSSSTDLQGYVGNSDLDKPLDQDAMVTEDNISAIKDRQKKCILLRLEGIERHLREFSSVAAYAANGYWNLDGLPGGLPDDIIAKVHAVSPPRASLENDTPLWAASTDGNFNLKSVYVKLAPHYIPDIDSRTCNQIWKRKGTPRIQCFLWKCIHDAQTRRKPLCML
ncbi:hypothetical protein SESBI_39178 [Sesbania bispinosa]|nr:hypothetical protein SESBI_39178 [Sesbania bispinosa]